MIRRHLWPLLLTPVGFAAGHAVGDRLAPLLGADIGTAGGHHYLEVVWSIVGGVLGQLLVAWLLVRMAAVVAVAARRLRRTGPSQRGAGPRVWRPSLIWWPAGALLVACVSSRGPPVVARG